MIFTSRYSNRELRVGKYFPVGISVGRPKFNLGYLLRDQCFALAPKGNMLQMAKEPYQKAYIEKIEAIGAGKIVKIVRGFDTRARDEGKQLVLLCYEDIRDPANWCHRTMFAEWWLKQTGEIIEELPDPSPVKLPKKPVTVVEPQQEMDQMCLF